VSRPAGRPLVLPAAQVVGGALPTGSLGEWLPTERLLGPSGPNDVGCRCIGVDTEPCSAGGVSLGRTAAWFAADGCGSATCEPLWTASTGGSAVSGGPAVSGGQLYVGTADGQVMAYGLP